MRRQPLLVSVQVRSRLRQQHDVVQPAGLRSKEQRRSAVSVSKMDRRSLAEEVAENLEVGARCGEVLEERGPLLACDNVAGV
jgi:hypothetical protein